MAANRHRLALLTWAVAYPLITGLLVALEPLLSGWVLPLKTLVLTAIMVPVMVYCAMPFATARLAGWLTETACKEGSLDRQNDFADMGTRLH